MVATLVQLAQLCGVFAGLRRSDPLNSFPAIRPSFTAIRNHPFNANRSAIRFLGPPSEPQDIQNIFAAQPGSEGLVSAVPSDALKLYCGITDGLVPKGGVSDVLLKDAFLIPGYYLLSFKQALAFLSDFGETINDAKGESHSLLNSTHFPIMASGSGDYITMASDGAIHQVTVEDPVGDDEFGEKIHDNLQELFETSQDRFSSGAMELLDGLLVDSEEEANITRDDPDPEPSAYRRVKRETWRDHRLAKWFWPKFVEEVRRYYTSPEGRRLKRQTINEQTQATNILGRLATGARGGRNLLQRTLCKLPEYLTFPCENMGQVCSADEEGVMVTGKRRLRFHDNKSKTRRNRRHACRDIRISLKGIKLQNCEEYPFASTDQGGCRFGRTSGPTRKCAHAAPVPAVENSRQGGYLRWFYFALKIKKKACPRVGKGKKGGYLKLWFTYMP